MSMRGDTELVLRLAFHRTPQAQWKELGQTILSLDGIHGEVTAVKPADPLATHDPFELDIEFAQPNFLNWSAKRETTPLPLLAIGLPDPPADAAKPIELGSPLNVTVKLKLDLPPIFAAQPPVASSVVARLRRIQIQLSFRGSFADRRAFARFQDAQAACFAHGRLPRLFARRHRGSKSSARRNQHGLW